MNMQFELVVMHADRVELLESETDRVDQSVTAGAHRTGRVHRHPLAVGNRTGFRDRREICIHARGRRRNVLTKELLANKQTAAGRRGTLGLTGKRKEQGLAKQTGPFIRRR